MSHLGEKLVDYVFDALSAPERAEADRHLAGCADCSRQLQQFQSTQQMLRSLPDEAPPRRLVVAPAAATASAAPWWSRWWVPSAVAAAFLLAMVLILPLHVRWGAGQLDIAFGETPVIRQEVASLPAAVQPVAVDYDRIVRELRESDREWLQVELRKRDAAREGELKRIEGSLAYYESLQRTVWKETIQNSASIQLLARRAEPSSSGQ